MNHDKSKGFIRGQTIPVMVVVSAIALWCSGLSIGMYNINGQVSGLSTSVVTIEKNTDGLPDLKAKINWLAEQQGYKPALTALATTTVVQ